MKKKIVLLALGLCFGVFALNAQSFVTPLDGGKFIATVKEDSYITKKDGTKLTGGKFTSVSIVNGYIKSLGYKDTDGNKIKINSKSTDYVEVGFDLGKAGNILGAGAGSLKQAVKGAGDAVKLKYHIFRLIEPKKGKKYLMELLNPNFSDKIEVYRDPKAKQTGGLGYGGIKLTGGIDKSYYLIKDGKSTFVEKKKYKKQFAEIYDKCPYMLEKYPKIDWKQLPEHIDAYTKNCK